MCTGKLLGTTLLPGAPKGLQSGGVRSRVGDGGRAEHGKEIPAGSGGDNNGGGHELVEGDDDVVELVS
jgi:hypothetical protein